MKNNTKILISCLIIIIIICIFIFITKNEKKQIENFKNEIIKNSKIPDQLDLLTYSKFSPKCCPSTYSSSSGCLCNDYNEFEAIISRGGNRII